MNKYFMNILLSAAWVAFVPGLLSAAETTTDTLPTVQQKMAEGKAVLVDVREKAEWDAGHIKDAIFLPLSALRRGLDAESLTQQLPKDKIVYTHCVVGKRSLIAADILEKLGYDARSLKPGYKELVQAGFQKAE